MTAELQERLHLGHLPGSWVTSNFRTSFPPQTQTSQLLFNRALPANPYNRATQVGPPPSIVIEKLVPQGTKHLGDGDSHSSQSSMRFSVVSEERLQAAVCLARKDWRRKRQELDQSSNGIIKETNSRITRHQSDSKAKQIPVVSKEEVTKSGARVFVYTPQKLPVTTATSYGHTPPNRDPGMGSPKPQLSLEVRRLHKELGAYIQRIEQLVNRGTIGEEPLDPEEQRRAKVRQQEQAARSARIIYGLQQQVKEIQEDLDKLRSQKINAKKSRAMDRLAAAHRGALRAMQVFIGQLSNQPESIMPSHHKELGQLIRQLSLCSAKMEVRSGSSVPETTIDILQRLEALDSAISKQQNKATPAQVSSPPKPQLAWQSSSPPPRDARGRHSKPSGVRKKAPDRRVKVTFPHPKSGHPLPLDRSQLLHVGLSKLIQSKQDEKVQKSKLSVQVPDKVGQPDRIRTPGHFQQPTVSSRLRESELPEKDTVVPWIPTSPHALAQHRAHPGKLEPRCLFSPPKLSAPQAEQQLPVGETHEKQQKHKVDLVRLQQARSEALRQAWLDKLTTQRLKELEQLGREESELIQRHRSEAISSTYQDIDRNASEKPLSLLDQEQIRDQSSTLQRHTVSEKTAHKITASTEVLHEAWKSDKNQVLQEEEVLVEQWLQAPTLESMLLKLEEMERDQEAVRRRFVHISYLDPRDWAAEVPMAAPSSGPTSPKPIRLTKPVLRHEPAADIQLEEPVDTGEAFPLREENPRLTLQKKDDGRASGTVLSVPTSMLGNILQYRQEHHSYLRQVAHEATGCFNPWTIADSLADELLVQTLAEVAGEFQQVCEEYAEAVFTSEFLQPPSSSPASPTQP